MDMELNVQDRQNFGWFYGTHKRVTRFALRNLNNLKPFQDTLEEFAQRPDFDEKGLFNNWHFYCPIQQKSFLDFNAKSNAFAKYKEHVSKMLTAVDEKNTEEYIGQAGRALHYLQDMTQPQHTKRGFIFNKVIGLRTHLAFEGFVKKNQQDCFSAYQEKAFSNKSYDDLFLENVKISSKTELPVGKNRYAWERIGRNGINQAIYSTREFLIKLNRLLDEDKQLKLPFD